MLSKGLSGVFSSNKFENINSSALSLLYGPTLTSIYDYWKAIVLTIWTFAGKVMSLFFVVVVVFCVFKYSLGTSDGDCSHEIKRRLLLGRKVMTNLDSILKSRHYFVKRSI